MSYHCPKKWLDFFKAAHNQHRQKILALINEHKDINAGQILAKMKLSQPTVSHHLKILREADLIKANKKGKEVYFSVNKKCINNCCTGFMKKIAKS
ncbi:winged helix-turn-helix transcriptional regulator [Candidatus Microgenomates bacterium]|nr:winged helix-turn-helix transcriptional regulator [Candidatus Microgenomates bacterium]